MSKIVFFRVLFIRERHAVVKCVEEGFVFMDQGDAFYVVMVPSYKAHCGVDGEWTMDVFGDVGCRAWSGKETVSRKVMMKIVSTVANGRMMNFNDCGLLEGVE
jgi:hypothetical protein